MKKLLSVVFVLGFIMGINIELEARGCHRDIYRCPDGTMEIYCVNAGGNTQIGCSPRGYIQRCPDKPKV